MHLSLPATPRLSRLLRRSPIRLLLGLLLSALLMVGALVLLHGVGSWLRVGPAGHELLSSMARALGAVLGLALVARWLEARTLAQLGLGHRLHDVRALGWGFAAGLALVSAVVGLLALAGWYRLAGVAEAPGLAGQLLGMVLLFFFVALWEEVLFRGLLFRVLEQGLGSALALLSSAGLFALVHLSNPNADGAGAVGVALAGALLAAAYVWTRSLWWVTGLHWAWNLALGPLYGLPVSGLQLPHLLEGRLPGPARWTGGEFGPEGGVMAFLVLGLGASWLIGLAVRRGEWQPRRWARPAAPPAQKPDASG